ncbi:MAG: zinc-binding dehydrogenase [Chloroflexota bacterium]|nr:zinc-binding dehydrogenase [Chloroflexota bacterium]
MIEAVVMPGPHQPLEVRQFAEPRLEAGAILLRTLGSEVCGTDVHLWHGQLAGVPYPIIPGHVSVGQVAAIGGQAADVDGRPLAVGDIVTFLDVYGSCGRCWYCTVAQASTRCPQRRVYGITLPAEEGLLGGWGQYIYLRPGVHVVAVPPELPWTTLLAAGCGLPTALHAVERADVRFGDVVVIQGSGPVGLSAAILAQLQGAGQVVVVGGPTLRLNMAEQLGADAVVDIATTDAAERIDIIHELTNGRGADVTIEATGVASAVPEGMRLTRDAGRYVVVGQYTNAGDVSFNPHLDLNQKHLDVRGCWGSDVGHVYRAVRVLARYHTRFPWANFVSGHYSLAQAQQALEDVAAQRVVKALIIPQSDPPERIGDAERAIQE